MLGTTGPSASRDPERLQIHDFGSKLDDHLLTVLQSYNHGPAEKSLDARALGLLGGNATV
jgi:hypothetical protein